MSALPQPPRYTPWLSTGVPGGLYVVVEHPVLGALYHVEVLESSPGVFELSLTDLVNETVIDLNTFDTDPLTP